MLKSSPHNHKVNVINNNNIEIHAKFFVETNKDMKQNCVFLHEEEEL